MAGMHLPHLRLLVRVQVYNAQQHSLRHAARSLADK